MTSTWHIAEADLRGLADDLIGRGVAVVAPARETAGLIDQDRHAEYRRIGSAAEMDLKAPLTRRSLKELFLPATEPILKWKQTQGDVAIEEIGTKFPPQVVLAARPCDAAGVEILDKVMGWDYRDDLWFGRREATTIIALACPGVDASCFCTAVGLAPDTIRGSDILLVPAGAGFVAEAHTPKGETFVKANAARFKPLDASVGDAKAAAEYRKVARAKIEPNLKIAPDKIQKWLDGHFEHPFWTRIGFKCHGCSACAFVCPTCHCFDCVDEPDRLDRGTRCRNWDGCQSGKFTVHASGHNPRANQNARYRQRLMHKFRIYPMRFGQILCTGCGRCSRVCPGGMDLSEFLTALNGLAAAEAQKPGGAA